MRRKMNVASFVLSIIIAAGSVCGCGSSKMTETTASQDSAYEEPAMEGYKQVEDRDEYREEFNQLVRMVAKRG